MSTPAANGATSRPGIHPGIVVGAIAVVVFGAAGAASYLGLLPGQPAKVPATPVSVANPAQQAGIVPDAVVPPAPVAFALAPAPVAPAPVAAAPAPQPAPEPVQAQPAPPKPQVARPAQPKPQAAKPAPSTPAYASNAPAYASNAPAYETAAPPQGAATPAPQPPPPVAKACRDCGTISSITPVEKKGESSGAGAVLGGVLGGVLGHQVGGGRGKDVATVAGALGGALVGNEIEKNQGTVTAWDVRVRLEDGSSRVVRYDTEPSWRVGDKVRIENGKIVRG